MPIENYFARFLTSRLSVSIPSCLNKDHVAYSSPLEAEDTTTYCHKQNSHSTKIRLSIDVCSTRSSFHLSMHPLCIANRNYYDIDILVTSLTFFACFIIIVVAIFYISVFFNVFYSCLVCICHSIIKGYLLTYLTFITKIAQRQYIFTYKLGTQMGAQSSHFGAQSTQVEF